MTPESVTTVAQRILEDVPVRVYPAVRPVNNVCTVVRCSGLALLTFPSGTRAYREFGAVLFVRETDTPMLIAAKVGNLRASILEYIRATLAARSWRRHNRKGRRPFTSIDWRPELVKPDRFGRVATR